MIYKLEILVHSFYIRLQFQEQKNFSDTCKNFSFLSCQTLAGKEEMYYICSTIYLIVFDHGSIHSKSSNLVPAKKRPT